MERGKHKVELIEELGKVIWHGRTYKICQERIVNTGAVYTSVKLYNAQGRFIKRFMLEPEIAGEVGAILARTAPTIPITEIAQRFPHLCPNNLPY